MKNKILVCTVIALSLGAGGLSFAQDNDSRHRGAERQQERRGAEGRDRYDDRRDGHRDSRRDVRREVRRDERREDRGAGPNRDFYRGGRISNEYRHRRYVVEDWRGHRLHAPPRGYHWVQTGGDYVLVAIATGVIVELLLNN